MPEGDSVYLVAARLRRALVGHVLTRTEFRVPRHATADLTGRTVLDVVARGKHLLTRLEGGVTLHTHMQMAGAWDIRPTGARPPGPAYEIRLALGSAEWTAYALRMPVVELLGTHAERAVVGHLGPDLLGPGWDPGEAVRRLSTRPTRSIGDALLDQRCLAGIGNVYKSELCFLRGVHPDTPVAAAGPLLPTVELAQRLLYANRERHGHVTTGDLRPGRSNWVYGRAGRPCMRCGAEVRRAQTGTPPRVTFWCPACQPPQ